MVIKQLVIKILTCLTFLIQYIEVYSEQLLLKNIFKINFGSEAFGCLEHNQTDKINPILNSPKLVQKTFFKIFFFIISDLGHK